MRVKRFGVVTLAALVFAATAALGALSSDGRHDRGHGAAEAQKFVFFASDGMRQDLIAKYLDKKSTLGTFLKKGVRAAGNGLLTQAPPNTGAGWYSLATGAWPGVHGSTNNTFHINGRAFDTSTSFATPGILKAETIAQAAERAGKKVAQMEWVGGRNGVIQGPTIDFQAFFSGRGVSTNFTGHPGEAIFDDPVFIQSFGLQFDHPAGFAGQAPFAGAAPVDATGWSGPLPATFSPAKEMRLRVLDFGVDKYGLNAWIFDSTNDHRTNYDKVLFSPTKSAADKVAILRKGEFADVKVKIIGGTSAGLTAGMLVKVEELTSDLSRVRLFHTSVARALATWPTWPGEPGFTGDFAEFLAQKFPSSQAADFAVLEAGVVSEETYVQQGLYWKTGHLPMLDYIVKTYKPDFLMAGVPTTDEFSHQFLGLVTPKLPNGAPNPAFDDVDLNGVKDHRVAQRDAFIAAAYNEANDVLMRARELIAAATTRTSTVTATTATAAGTTATMTTTTTRTTSTRSSRQTTASARSSSRSTRACRWCSSGCSRSRRPRTAAWRPARRSARRRPAGPAVRCRCTSTSRAATRPAAACNRWRQPTPPSTVAAIKAKYLSLTDPNDWTHDGQPENWKMIDRAFTQAEARFIPNGPGSTADMADPTRTGDLVVFAFPPYQFDAETPGTLVAPSTSSASTATCPTSRTSTRTSTCGRRSWPTARTSARAR